MQPVLVWVAIASVVAFVLAVWDKAAAKRRRPRVPEATLLGAALVGGSPGLLLGMLLVRHKTRKGSFLLRLGAILLLQAAIAVWYVTAT